LWIQLVRNRYPIFVYISNGKKDRYPLISKNHEICHTPGIWCRRLPIFYGASHLALLLVVLGIIVLTTNYVTEINLGEKSYDDYLLFLWIPMNRDKKRFRFVDRIIISKGNYLQTINTRIQSRQMNWTDYTGTLILDNDKLDLVTHTNKKELLHALKTFSDFLKVDVEDRTTGDPYWIDMTKY